MFQPQLLLVSTLHQHSIFFHVTTTVAPFCQCHIHTCILCPRYDNTRPLVRMLHPPMYFVFTPKPQLFPNVHVTPTLAYCLVLSILQPQLSPCVPHAHPHLSLCVVSVSLNVCLQFCCWSGKCLAVPLPLLQEWRG